MNHHEPPHAPPPNIDLHTTSQILKQTSSIFISHRLKLAFVAFLLLAFRYNVETGAHFLAAFVDGDASLKSLLSSRIDISGKNLHTSSAANHHPRQRRPFLHLTRVGTVDGDFFSGDEDHDRSLFGPHPRTPPNGSFVRLGFPNYVSDNGIRVSEFVRTGFSFTIPENSFQSVESGEDNNITDKLKKVENSLNEDENDRVMTLQFLIKGFELRRREASDLFFMGCLIAKAVISRAARVLCRRQINPCDSGSGSCLIVAFRSSPVNWSLICYKPVSTSKECISGKMSVSIQGKQNEDWVKAGLCGSKSSSKGLVHISS